MFAIAADYRSWRSTKLRLQKQLQFQNKATNMHPIYTYTNLLKNTS